MKRSYLFKGLVVLIALMSFHELKASPFSPSFSDGVCQTTNGYDDADNDGFSNLNDEFPCNSNEWLDSDKNGIGNNAQREGKDLLQADLNVIEDELGGVEFEFKVLLSSNFSSARTIRVLYWITDGKQNWLTLEKEDGEEHYSVDITLPSYIKSGVYEVRRIDVVDNSGNTVEFDKDFLLSEGYAFRATINNESSDSVLPILADMSVTNLYFTSNGDINVDFLIAATDEDSGLEQRYILELTSPTGKSIQYSGYFESHGVHSTESRLTVVMPKYSVSGIYKVNTLRLYDLAGNYNSSTQWLQENNINIQLENPNSDNTSPELIELSLSDNYDLTTSRPIINVEAVFKDDFSGLNSSYIRLKKPELGILESWLTITEDNAKIDTLFTTSFALQNGYQKGSYEIDFICFSDNANNEKCYYFSELAQLGFQNSININYQDSDGDGVIDIYDAFPHDKYETLDQDSDGIGNNADLDDDNDGISDEDELKFGLDPLDPTDASLAPANTMVFNDTNGDGTDDWLFSSFINGNTQFSIIDGRDFTKLTAFELSDGFDSTSIELLGDRNNDGIKEIGLFGFNADVGRYQLAVYNGYTGQSMGTWNWPDTLQDVEFKLLEDLTLDGVQEYAITGIHLTNGTKQLFVKDGASKQTYQTFKWTNQWLDAQIVQMSDITNDGVPEVALYGRHERLDKGQLFVFDGANSNNKLDVYNWNKLWNDISLHKMDDLDGDGTTDWGQFGQRKDDGRYQWLVKKGHDKQGVIRTFSWPNDLTAAQPLLLSDRTGDDVKEVALYGKNGSGKLFLRVNDGRLANTRIANYSWPATWLEEQVMELGDLNNDGTNEVALLGINKNTGKYQLVVKDGQAGTEYGRLTFEGDWADLAISSYDANSDGQADIIVNGVDVGTLKRSSLIYSGDGLGLLSTTVH